MKIINCKQRSNEWYKARRGIATASDFDKIITGSGRRSEQLNSYAFKLVSDCITTSLEESYTNEAMERGQILEDEARIYYEENTLSTVKEVGFIKKDNYGCSPDGLVEDFGVIEIKCRNRTLHTKLLYEKKVPTMYIPQIQGVLLVTGRQWCDFISYHPDFIEDYKMFILRVNRDKEYIEQLKILLSELNDKKKEILKKIEKDNLSLLLEKGNNNE